MSAIDEKGVPDMSDPEVWKYWTELAQSDPKRFQEERKAIALAHIAKAPAVLQPALRELQSHIDAICTGDPVIANIRLHSMIQASLNRLSDAWVDLAVAVASATEDVKGEPVSGETRILSRIQGAK